MGFCETKRLHRRGQHLLAYGDGGPDWCRRCGTFAHMLGAHCHAIPRLRRWWPQRGATNKEG